MSAAPHHPAPPPAHPPTRFRRAWRALAAQPRQTWTADLLAVLVDAVAARTPPRPRRWIAEHLTGTRSELTQQIKAAAAAGLAWWLAGTLLGTGAPIFAALTAYFAVEATIARSVASTRANVVGLALGLVTGAVTVHAAGTTPLAVTGALLVTLLAGRAAGLDEAATANAASAAVVALTLGNGLGHQVLLRLLSVVLGAGVAVAVNATVSAPVHVQPAGDTLARIAAETAALLRAAAGATETLTRASAEGWLSTARTLASRTADAHEDVSDALESLRYQLPGTGGDDALTRLHAQRLPHAAEALEHTVLQVRGLARALLDLTDPPGPAPLLPEALGRLMRRSADLTDAYGRCVQLAQHTDAAEYEQTADQLLAALAAARAGIDPAAAAVRAHFTAAGPAQRHAIVYGSILADLTRVLDELDPHTGAHREALPSCP